MTLVPSLLGAPYDAPETYPVSLEEIDDKRALALYRLNEAQRSGDADIERLMYWELGLVDLMPSFTGTDRLFRGADYDQYAKHYRFTSETTNHAKERRTETSDLRLAIRYAEFTLVAMTAEDGGRVALLRDLAALYSDFVRRSMAQPDSLTGVLIERALGRLATIVSVKSVLPHASVSGHAIWAVELAKQSRDLPVRVPEERDQQRPRWVGPFLRHLLSLPCQALSGQAKKEVIELLHEARDYYRIDPLNHEFEARVLDTELALRTHWKERGIRPAILRQKAESVARRAQFHAAAGSPLVAATFYRDSTRMLHENADAFTPNERQQALIAEQQNLERLSGSGELARVSVPIEIPREHMDRSRETSAETVEELLALAESNFSKARATAAAAEAARESPLLHLIGRQSISGGKIVGESEGGEKNLELDAESQVVFFARILGASAMMTILGGVARSGLSVDDLIQPLAVLPLQSNTVSLIRHGVERALDRDWISATHILAIQAESVLRQLLKAGGFATTKLKPDVGDGTSRTDDQSIGGLLARTRADGVRATDFIGEDLAWRFNVLLASQTGANLRNLVAHGDFPAAAFGMETTAMPLLLFYSLAQRWKTAGYSSGNIEDVHIG